MKNTKEILRNKNIHYIIGFVLSIFILSIITGNLLQSIFISLVSGWIFAAPKLVKEIKNSKVLNYIIKYLPPVLILISFLLICKPDLISFLTSILVSLLIFFEFMAASILTSAMFIVMSPLIIVISNEFILRNTNFINGILGFNDNCVDLIQRENIQYMILALFIYALTGIITLFSKHKARSHVIASTLFFVISILKVVFLDVSNEVLKLSNFTSLFSIFKEFNIATYVQNNSKWLIISVIIIVLYILITNVMMSKDVYYFKKHRIIKGITSIIITVLLLLLVNVFPNLNLIYTV